MSDFVARLAARAAGRPPLAGPGLPALFEERGPSEEPARLEIGQSEFAAGGTAGRETAAGGPPTPRGTDGAASGPIVVPGARAGSRRLRRGGEEVRRAPVREPGKAASPRAAERVPGPPGSAAAAPSRAGPTRDEGGVPGPAEPATPGTEDAAPPSRPELVAPVRAVAAAVQAHSLADGVPESPAPRAGMGGEAPEVRIHIGRIEVRANLSQAPPLPRPRSVDGPPPGLSLSDYLRGKREGR